MRFCACVFGVCFIATVTGRAADLNAADVLRHVSDRYKQLHTYDIKAEERVSMTQGGLTNSSQRITRLAVGINGAFRVETSGEGETEISVSEGRITWKALPNSKVWCKQDVAQITDVDDEDSDDQQQSLGGQDLFGQTQRNFVSRYVGLNRYANTAVLEKSEKVKINGGKVECYVVRLGIRSSSHKLFVTMNDFIVAKHIELLSQPGRQVEFSTDYKSFNPSTPPPDVFEFEPPSGSKEVSSLLLPSERNMSLVGKKAVDFSLKSLDGTPVRLFDLRGKVVLLDFWATWCPPCRHELPTIEAISRKYSEHNVAVFGVNDEEAATAKRFLEKNHPDLQTLHDGGGKVHHIYGCNSIPTVLVINPSGTIVAHFVGERAESELIGALKQAGMN